MGLEEGRSADDGAQGEGGGGSSSGSQGLHDSEGRDGR